MSAQARRERDGFVIFHDVFENQLQYLAPEDFKRVMMAAYQYSRAYSLMDEEPRREEFPGFVGGAYNTLVGAIERNAYQYAKKAAMVKWGKLAKRIAQPGRPAPDVSESAMMTDETLKAKGFSKRDIFVFRTETGGYPTSSDVISNDVKSSEMNNQSNLELNRADPIPNWNLSETGAKPEPERPDYLRTVRADVFEEALMQKCNAIASKAGVHFTEPEYLSLLCEAIVKGRIIEAEQMTELARGNVKENLRRLIHGT